MGRKNQGDGSSFGTPADTGLMGFRYPGEPPDSRPVIVLPPLWEDDTERQAYEHAVHTNPRREGEGVFTYLQRICAVVTGRYLKAGMEMPRARMGRLAAERRRNALNRQAQTL